MKEELRVIPKKNYIILGVVIIITLLLLYYFYMWFNVYDKNKVSKPILDKYMDYINYNEIDDYLVENPNSIIYVSVLDNKEISDFEVKLKDSFRNHKITKEVLYLDITNDIKDKNKALEMDGKYSLNNLSIRDVPCVLIFDSGKLKSIYSIKDNGYDVLKFINFGNGVNSEIEDKLND